MAVVLKATLVKSVAVVRLLELATQNHAVSVRIFVQRQLDMDVARMDLHVESTPAMPLPSRHSSLLKRSRPQTLRISRIP